MPEIGLAIGREQGTYLGRTREWLYWYDNEGRLLTPEEVAQQERQRANQEQQRANRLAARLQELGINPDELEG
jgi:hypothetical protein